jgi:hypothetical protein
MEHTQIEVIKAEVLTLANDLKVIAGKLDFLMALRPVKQKPVDFEDPELIEEWVGTYGYDYDSSFSDAVEVNLESESYGYEIRINAEKETDSSSRDRILMDVIERYLKWAKNQKETYEQEADENEF